MTESRALHRVLIDLMKLRVVVLLQVTAVCAILVHDLLVRYGSIAGDRSWLDTVTAVSITLVGGTLSAGGSNAINMWYDADIDPLMSRTAKRPIPSGEISPRAALLFGLLISTGGSAVFLLAHWKAAFWSAFSVLFYVLVYTVWLKRRSPQNIVIGGIAGATPPLIGWAVAAAETGALAGMNPLDLGSPVPWMLFVLIFLWTPPHFWALALYRSGEYAKAQVPMMNEVRGAAHTLLQSKIYCGSLGPRGGAHPLARIRPSVALDLGRDRADGLVCCLGLEHRPRGALRHQRTHAQGRPALSSGASSTWVGCS